MTAMDPRTPVLVGVGLVMQRVDDPTAAREPIELMIEAARATGQDAGSPELLASLDRILVPVGRWRYGDAGAMVGKAVGSPGAGTVSALPGVSQQTILSDAASAIADGEITTALVVGGEAGHRLRCARTSGTEIRDTDNTATPDVVLRPDDPFLPLHERERGLGVMPVGYYALIDSAWRHAHGISIDERREQIAARYRRFSETAAANPHGWNDAPVDLDAIRGGTMISFPYTRHHVSNWSVDQASALLLTSVAEAERRGVPRDRWVFPHAFSEANDMVDVSARRDLHRSVGAELAARAVLDAADCGPGELDVVELYTCFPIAVDIYAEALGLPPERDLTFTGGMPFAGGPFNNFVLHSTAQVAEELRGRSVGRGLVTTVSGFLTKQGFAIWGAEPAPHGYQFVDVTDETSAATEVCAVAPDHTGPATAVAHTVVYDRSGTRCGVVVVDTPAGARSVASTSSPALVDALEREDLCGRRVRVDGATLAAVE